MLDPPASSELPVCTVLECDGPAKLCFESMHATRTKHRKGSTSRNRVGTASKSTQERFSFAERAAPSKPRLPPAKKEVPRKYLSIGARRLKRQRQRGNAAQRPSPLFGSPRALLEALPRLAAHQRCSPPCRLRPPLPHRTQHPTGRGPTRRRRRSELRRRLDPPRPSGCLEC